MLDQAVYRARFLELETASAQYDELRKELDVFQKRVGEPRIADEERRTLPTHKRYQAQVTKRK